ncbi:MAG: putative tRNA threonylcarbamoyladenosine biosynthesis protein Gcp [Candidatus Uhrbacteria bacterium GW2011_GWF2_39_13]|uniref:tRNA N6-adenosine threonylcarbamoyltransferase n=1 Tax=Candidatus Uhrbacteria bacterium GW2011_GWF2_39_13 TaxID=1618995 RepID=A0A0G0MUU7_9BACT|nr:MAG: putative tRNA threonylcarbamoyladenosine biosynthesis protein Gcp [Candidatus Uhrbacteria bacterium GW2011_GWF2_39_13]HAU66631.1 tRNA (adenosine(37)-N6)-threonylcarbamoyltransferase complex transferase subunit TsaD [Candidatus Uhrbacteria bacterium]
MRILSIETSCDETSLAIVAQNEAGFMVEKNLVSSQATIHAQYGGVVPEVAAREHAAWIFPLMQELEIPHDGKRIDAIAVTAGPGLVPALRIGVELGKVLAWSWHKPLVAVNHLEGHLYSVWLETPHPPVFPAVCLLVSGGHTELILMKNHGEYQLLGMTRDDAAGEAFDKVAKLLELPYPGGPMISKIALEGDSTMIDFPRPMFDSPNLDFSFSGLKTAVRLCVEEFQHQGTLDPSVRAGIAASFQQAVVDVLVHKTLKAVQQTHPKSVILSGGVSANRLLRETLREKLSMLHSDITFHSPPLAFTGDNAAMIGVAGLIKAKRKEFVDPLSLHADPNMSLTSL